MLLAQQLQRSCSRKGIAQVTSPTASQKGTYELAPFAFSVAARASQKLGTLGRPAPVRLLAQLSILLAVVVLPRGHAP